MKKKAAKLNGIPLHNAFGEYVLLPLARLSAPADVLGRGSGSEIFMSSSNCLKDKLQTDMYVCTLKSHLN